MYIDLQNLEEIKNLAIKLAESAEIGDVIELHGELGSGKTTFSRFFINTLAEGDLQIPSPTFNLVFLYNSIKGTIWHFDLYRLTAKDEIWELGIEEALDNGITLIEWPAIIADLLPSDKLILEFNFTADDKKRNVFLNPQGSWSEKLANLSLNN